MSWVPRHQSHLEPPDTVIDLKPRDVVAIRSISLANENLAVWAVHEVWWRPVVTAGGECFWVPTISVTEIVGANAIDVIDRKWDLGEEWFNHTATARQVDATFVKASWSGTEWIPHRAV